MRRLQAYAARCSHDVWWVAVAGGDPQCGPPLLRGPAGSLPQGALLTAGGRQAACRAHRQRAGVDGRGAASLAVLRRLAARHLSVTAARRRKEAGCQRALCVRAGRGHGGCGVRGCAGAAGVPGQVPARAGRDPRGACRAQTAPWPCLACSAGLQPWVPTEDGHCGAIAALRKRTQWFPSCAHSPSAARARAWLRGAGNARPEAQHAPGHSRRRERRRLAAEGPRLMGQRRGD
jgi:hypothetical protein